MRLNALKLTFRDNKIKIRLLALALTASLILCGCSHQSGSEAGHSVTGETGDPETMTGPGSSDVPDESGVRFSEVSSVLGANGLYTNINSWSDEGAAWHGGQQTRICRTERGIYTAFAKEFGDDDDQQKFYVARTDSDGTSKILYYGQFTNDGGEITVNIGHDTVTGNIIATATTQRIHEAYVFDAETDEMTAYKTKPVFSSGKEPSYSQVMYDFENRKIYVFSICGSGTKADTVGDFLLEWMTFDLETRSWSESSVYSWTKDIGRHAYMYPFPDGNGGAYIVAMRNEYAVYAADRFSMAVTTRTYIWDRLDLFHIPDMTTSDGVEYVMVQEEDDSLGDEGIWTNTQINLYGEAYIDSDGYIHITYRKYLLDYTHSNTDYDNKLEFRHAVYDGLTCVFNEKLDLKRDDYERYRPMVRQSTDGSLHLIVATLSDKDAKNIEMDIYSAEDSLGRSWKFEKTVLLDEGVTTDSLTLTAVREGSVQDGIISGFVYGYYGFVSTAYVFNMDLNDYSVTNLTDILDGYRIKIDDKSDKRIPCAEHQPIMVRTEKALYAALVYNFDHDEDKDWFHIVRIDEEGNAALLYTDCFDSNLQTRYLTMYMGTDGLIYVCPPTGNTVYTIDPQTDEITLRTLSILAPTGLNQIPQQVDMVFGPAGEVDYIFTTTRTNFFGISRKTYDAEEFKIPLKTEKYTFDSTPECGYTNMFYLRDGQNGLYIVGTRFIRQEELGGRLEYRGFTQSINDSAMLFYIPDLSEGNEIRCIDIRKPYEDEGHEGIWSEVKVNDAYLDSEGRLNVIYTYYLKDLDDADRRGADSLTESSLRHMISVYEKGELVSKDEIGINGINKDCSIRMTESADGTKYLVECNLLTTEMCLSLRWNIIPEEDRAKIKVFRKDGDGWVPAAEMILGEFAAEGMYLSSPRNGSAHGGTADVLVFGSDKDVHYLSIEFE
ncbi:MAG: hypothetical protein J6128_05000 [Clostridia bacterium]|nr:hypothetical protein [Clostridia bacterium]